jgi:hypothetical protein
MQKIVIEKAMMKKMMRKRDDEQNDDEESDDEESDEEEDHPEMKIQNEIEIELVSLIIKNLSTRVALPTFKHTNCKRQNPSTISIKIFSLGQITRLGYCLSKSSLFSCSLGFSFEI